MSEEKPTVTRAFVGDSMSIKPLQSKLISPETIIEKGLSFAALAPKLTAPSEAPKPATPQSEPIKQDK